MLVLVNAVLSDIGMLAPQCQHLDRTNELINFAYGRLDHRKNSCQAA
jgi:hypothetical protein